MEGLSRNHLKEEDSYVQDLQAGRSLGFFRSKEGQSAEAWCSWGWGRPTRQGDMGRSVRKNLKPLNSFNEVSDRTVFTLIRIWRVD